MKVMPIFLDGDEYEETNMMEKDESECRETWGGLSSAAIGRVS